MSKEIDKSGIKTKNRKTALVLGGGGARGAYEAGVWQALRELGVTIDCVFGTSVGSITAAVIAQDDFELCIKIWHELETEKVFGLDVQKSDKQKKYYIDIAGMPANEARAYLKEMTKGGASVTGLEDLLKKYIDEDRVRSSHLEYGLTTFELSTLTPLYLKLSDIPEGMLNDYIIASCSVAPAIKPREIDGKQYIDGGYHDTVPIHFALETGATDIIAVNLKAPGFLKTDNYNLAREKCDSFHDISCPWDLGNMLAFNKVNAHKFIRLGYLDTLKSFGIFSGNYFTFPNKEYGKRDLQAADIAAKIFELDPTIIYTKKSLEDALAEKIEILLAKKGNLKLEFGSIKTFIKKIVTEKDGEELLTILVAEEIKKQQPNPLLNTRAADKLMQDIISAARYLVTYNLI